MKFTLEANHKTALEKLAKSGMTPILTARRAKILLLKEQGKSSSDIASELNISRHTVELWVKKYRSRTPKDSLEDLLKVSEGRGRKEQISGEARIWLISIACMKPKDLGYAAEVWTTSSLTKHIRTHALEAGYERLCTITESGVYKILNKSNMKPFRIQYDCERRDPDFEQKMHNVLLVYKQLSLQFDQNGKLLPFEDGDIAHVLSYDEKPGIQAIANTADDLMPNGSKGVIKRDYEYKRLGTVSLLAGIDLQTGEAIPLVKDTHNSDGYIEFLKVLDRKYPKEDKIRLVLDNLKVHRSENVQKYISTVPGRFESVFTPKHASWLNLVEGFFSKMTKQMLKGVRVATKDELVRRIYKYFEEINAEPVVYKWNRHLDNIDPTEQVQVVDLAQNV